MSNYEPKFAIGTSAILSRFRVICSCDLDTKTGYPNRFVGFPQFLQTRQNNISKKSLATSFQILSIHCSLIVVPFDFQHWGQLTASLRKLKTSIWILSMSPRWSSPSPAQWARTLYSFERPRVTVWRTNIFDTLPKNMSATKCAPTRYLHVSESFLRS